MGPSANHRRGFTLVEAVTSMVIAVVLLGGLGSAVLLATRALPRSDRPADAQLQEGPVLNRMITELQTACVISERTSRAIAFTVPDRDGDGRPERIRYAWSGTAGEPLTRTYNGGATTSLVADVRAFTLSYDVGSASEQYAGLPVQSGETLLRSYDSLLGLSEAHVHNDQWWAQYFKPSLPADALRWRVTRVRFVAKRDSGRDSTTAIQLLAPDDDTGLPSTTAVDSTTMAQLALPDAFTWIEKAFTKADNLAAGSGLYLAFTTTDSDSCRLRYRGSGVVLADAGLIEGDPAWKTLMSDKALLFYIYGTYFTPGPAVTLTRQYVEGVRIELRAGSDASAQLDTA
ncbi:MAG: prepilin-type N-terminal cleavage/methylation domain-containing protein, partial [Planctomycetota bacterium]